MIISKFNGRLANTLIQNIGLSILGKKLNLKVYKYVLTSDIKKFKLKLWNKGRVLENKSNPAEYSDKDIDLLFNKDFQPRTSIIFNGNFQNGSFLLRHRSEIKKMFLYEKEAALDSSKLILMLRIGDVEHLTPPIDFYKEAIADMQIKMGINTKIEGYITSDSPNHKMVRNLASTYGFKVIEIDACDTLKFAARFKNFILTGGSYNWLAAFLSEAENVIYPEHTYLWHGDIYSDFDWTKKNWSKHAPIRFFLLKNHFWKFQKFLSILRKIKKFIKL